MHQVDPMADKYSSHTPYKYGLNNPVYWNDSSGADEDAQKRQKWEEEHLRIRQQFEAARLTCGVLEPVICQNVSPFGTSYGKQLCMLFRIIHTAIY